MSTCLQRHVFAAGLFPPHLNTCARPGCFVEDYWVEFSWPLCLAGCCVHAAAVMQGLTRADAQAALLLAAEEGAAGEEKVEDALLAAVRCLSLGGCAMVWRAQHLPAAAAVNEPAAGAAAGAAQQEAARLLAAAEVEQVLGHLDATGGVLVNRSKVSDSRIC